MKRKYAVALSLFLIPLAGWVLAPSYLLWCYLKR